METQTTPVPLSPLYLQADSAKLEPLTYSVAEAAQVLGVSPVSIYRLIARRLLCPLPHLRHKRIPKRQVHAYVAGALTLEEPRLQRSA
jgi:excisionase family DNA binding protein